MEIHPATLLIITTKKTAVKTSKKCAYTKFKSTRSPMEIKKKLVNTSLNGSIVEKASWL
jgi:hypothetical protein